MQEIIFLKNIRKLFAEWGLSENDWFLTDGFFLKPSLCTFYSLNNKDHWHVLLNGSKIPWQVKTGEQVIPPPNTSYLKTYLDFLANNPELMLESESAAEFNKKIKKCETIEIDKNIYIKQIKPAKALYNLLVEQKINPNRYYELLEKAEKYADKVNDFEVFSLLKNIETNRLNKEIIGEPVNQIDIKGEIKLILPDQPITKDIIDKIIVLKEVLPKHLSLVLKSQGVISVIGGQTSHSAIVCREFNKPAFIGVEHAFYDFREGDLVEFDINNKQIKIIK
jgi:phosphohistidine swiveling domain-containing protein